MNIIYAVPMLDSFAKSTKTMHALLIIRNLSLIKLGHFDGVDTSIANVACYAGVVLPFVSDGLQECRATGAGAAKDETHLAGLHYARLSVISGVRQAYNAKNTRRMRTHGELD